MFNSRLLVNLHRVIDHLNSILIVFVILWGPWSSSYYRDWSINVMNSANFGIGLLILLKKFVVYVGRPTSNILSHKNVKNILILKPSSLNKAITGLILYLLIYILVSVLNYRAVFNYEFHFFEFNDSFIEWLPASFNKIETIKKLYFFSGLACFFWGFRSWLLEGPLEAYPQIVKYREGLGKTRLQDHIITILPNRLVKILWLYSINAALLSFIGIVHKLDLNTNLLLSIELFSNWSQLNSFGPFKYRSNAGSYFNMMLPVLLTFLVVYLTQTNIKLLNNPKRHSQPHIVLFPLSILTATAILLSSSRGSILILILVLISFAIKYSIYHNFQLKNAALFSILFIFIVGITTTVLNKGGIYNRFFPDVVRLPANIEFFKETEKLIYEFKVPYPPYNSDLILFEITNSSNPKYKEDIFYAILLKDGNLRLTRNLRSSKARLESTYTNFSGFLTEQSCRLEILFGTDELQVFLNGEQLSGYSNNIKANDFTWKEKIPSSFLYLRSNAKLKASHNDFTAQYIAVQPAHSNQTDSQIQLTNFEFYFDDYLSVQYISTLSPERFQLYKNSLPMAKEHAFFGVGMGAWSVLYFLYHDIDSVWEAWAHCDWLEYWICLGIFGSIPLYILIATVLFKGNQSDSIGLPPFLSFGIQLSLTSCLIHSLFDFPLNFYAILHLFVALCSIKSISAKWVSSHMTI